MEPNTGQNAEGGMPQSPEQQEQYDQNIDEGMNVLNQQQMVDHDDNDGLQPGSGQASQDDPDAMHQTEQELLFQ